MTPAIHIPTINISEVNNINKYLFFYSFFIAIIICLGSYFVNAKSGNIYLQFIFLPVVGYFIFEIVGKIRLALKQKNKADFRSLYPNLKRTEVLIIYLALFLALSTFYVGSKTIFSTKLLSPLATDTSNSNLSNKKLENALSPSIVTQSLKEAVGTNETKDNRKNPEYYVTIKSSTINIRGEPDLSGKVIQTASKGAVFPWVSTTKDGWVEILLEDGKKGWVDFHYVAKELNTK